LIADDNLRARKGLRVLLAHQPEVDLVGEAADVLTAMDMVQDHQPDVVLMDTHMPPLDGLEATRRIKESWPEIWIILTSMVAAHRAAALSAGADMFLVKGCPTEDLLAAILD
jgi:DNA-binding NarL/FixJ family response regulator